MSQRRLDGLRLAWMLTGASFRCMGSLTGRSSRGPARACVVAIAAARRLDQCPDAVRRQPDDHGRRDPGEEDEPDDPVCDAVRLDLGAMVHPAVHDAGARVAGVVRETFGVGMPPLARMQASFAAPSGVLVPT
jgi:hypothetical protein